jgi:CheY-like chemotaxis protein
MPRFLIVDDDPDVVEATSVLLVAYGHEVASFGSGPEAIDALARERFDVVVTDLEMSHVSGQVVAREARQHQPHACIVVSTGRTDVNDEYLLAAGACVVALKPFDRTKFMKDIEDCRAGGGPGQPGGCPLRSQPKGHDLVPLRRR